MLAVFGSFRSCKKHEKRHQSVRRSGETVRKSITQKQGSCRYFVSKRCRQAQKERDSVQLSFSAVIYGFGRNAVLRRRALRLIGSIVRTSRRASNQVLRFVWPAQELFGPCSSPRFFFRILCRSYSLCNSLTVHCCSAAES